MADVAFVFHWSPDWLMGRAASEILEWRDKALARWNHAYGAKE
ncbi:MAG: GpE family phage tail protein [Billgrantia sp.]|uniref:P2 GpE family protein n=1 Tax=Thioalkalivibrio sulfidiphilus (strain HL-EbGR7) TaxID=396588 RepID=B8GS06_THISH|nr:GpE family phage tail protein [Thioalkalivibrio sulfidiphilus]ACL72710.1 P2 GpE family protein [Thioalkalivibrio sulfidiphilus HL-EbGr7]